MIDFNFIYSNDDIFFQNIYFENLNIQRLLDELEQSNYEDKNLSLKLLEELISNYKIL